MLFSALMVRALLDGRKTQTRRLLNPQPPAGSSSPVLFRGDGQDRHVQFRDAAGDVIESQSVRFAPGDRLWVRETWRLPAIDDFYSPADVAKMAIEAGYSSPWASIEYCADGARENWSRDYGDPGRRRAALHMPRWASRITLIVTDVRVERLQEISEDDARAEGVFAVDLTKHTSVARFRELWDSINADRPGCAWRYNPWIAVITFAVERRNIDG
jgi:hypothetical protein